MHIIRWLLLGLALSVQTVSAQQIEAVSDTLRLDFGYPMLQARDSLIFTDENANRQIDPSEGVVITFTLMNQSRYPARGVVVKPNELNGVDGLVWPKQIKVGNIEANSETKVAVSIIAEDSLETGTANFAFVILEGDNIESTTVVYSVGTNQPDAPATETPAPGEADAPADAESDSDASAAPPEEGNESDAPEEDEG